MSQYLCQRCANHYATKQVGGLPMCDTCAAQTSYRTGASIFDPYGMGQELGQQMKRNDTSPLDPYSMGKDLGTVVKQDAPSLPNMSGTLDTVKKTASSLKTAAIIIGSITAAGILYVVYKQYKTAEGLQQTAFSAFAPQVVHHIHTPIPGQM